MNKPQSFVQFCKENNFVEIGRVLIQSRIYLTKEDGTSESFDVVVKSNRIPGFHEMTSKFLTSLIAIPYYGTTIFVTRVPLN